MLMDVCKEDPFKVKFKYYKANNPKPSLREVIAVGEYVQDDRITHFTQKNISDERAALLGLISLSKWELYGFRYHPGLFLIRNPFTTAGQRYWIEKCLKEYPRKPNKTNIDIEMSLRDWWAECYSSGQCNTHLQKKLRWTTLGYHHNWNTKVYSDENKNVFPEDLAELSDIVAGYMEYKHYKAEAAIVNYYHMDSTLSPHTDHSEVNMEAPLFSFSFGQSAIFLIGGRDKSTTPSAILLRSGDIVIMSQEARLCYHAVPKILPANSMPWNEEIQKPSCERQKIKFKYISSPEQISLINDDSIEWSRYRAYIEEARINMNVRQVLNEKQYSLTDVNLNVNS